MDTKLRKEIDEAREREKKYFNDDLKKDQPTGKTPGRVNRSYPKDIVEGELKLLEALIFPNPVTTLISLTVSRI